MDRENPIAPPQRRRQYKNSVTAAIDICEARRAQATGIEPSPHEPGGMRREVERTAVIVEAAAAKLDAHDFTALETVCASQVLALDVIFNEFARDAARIEDYLSGTSMGTALRAQSQCRMMLKALLSLAATKRGKGGLVTPKQSEGGLVTPKQSEGGLDARKKSKKSDDRIIESANPQHDQ